MYILINSMYFRDPVFLFDYWHFLPLVVSQSKLAHVCCGCKVSCCLLGFFRDYRFVTHTLFFFFKLGRQNLIGITWVGRSLLDNSSCKEQNERICSSATTKGLPPCLYPTPHPPSHLTLFISCFRRYIYQLL